MDAHIRYLDAHYSTTTFLPTNKWYQTLSQTYLNYKLCRNISSSKHLLVLEHSSTAWLDQQKKQTNIQNQVQVRYNPSNTCCLSRFQNVYFSPLLLNNQHDSLEINQISRWEQRKTESFNGIGHLNIDTTCVKITLILLCVWAHACVCVWPWLTSGHLVPFDLQLELNSLVLERVESEGKGEEPETLGTANQPSTLVESPRGAIA